jgi:Ser/Thr protein kinase RdoA (MazF antagonist)
MQRDNWIGTRDRDNFAYTKGQSPVYSKNCKNSLIITDSTKGKIEGRSNYALINKDGKEYLIPISEIGEILGISKKIFESNEILYKKPSSILEREILIDLGEDFIRKNIFENYGISIDSIKEIETKKGNHRVYEISSKGEKFMLKYHGKDLNLFDTQIDLLKDNPFFPRIIASKNETFHIIVEDSIYYLEEFLEGVPLPENKEAYYSLIGKNMALIHNEFNKVFSLKNGLEKCLIQKGNPFSESNLISMKIDLDKNFQEYFSTENIISFFKTLETSESSLPSQIIHGDLNKSNLIWNGDKAKAIDFEMIHLSKKINEFIPALLLGGNLSIPKYNSKSLNQILKGYNSYSNLGLTNKEINVLPDLLKISQIKSYVIYVLRRNLEKDSFKHQIGESLKILEEETNVH